MSDPLSVAAGVVGLTVPALHGTRLLLDDLQKIKDAPEMVQRLKGDVGAIDLALASLRAVKEHEWESLGTTVAEDVKTTISTCTRACDAFRADLQHWTRHSAGGKLTLQDRTKVGFWKQAEIRTISEQLQNCKITVTSVVSIATLYSSIRHSHVTEEIRQTISTNQVQIKSAIRTVDENLEALGSRGGELQPESGDEDLNESTSRVEALRQLEEERKAVATTRKLLDKLLAKAQEEEIQKAVAENQNRSTTATFGHSNSGFQANIVNGGLSGFSWGGK
ncbi:hypothetical protein P153DRAFT_421381 [Dothidotthia symphoricarpi CBS 119687]|uniref:Azaphilone pigments biosynthesis cluster protein L N-terminal domain-containing protein n=1 Tax=Dothidotthia symphoricarpi CBS 119687 TaxID=1392245 RepID=A0A6A6AKU8_9PLEO|nr:uncharacterized protein P153DRAFT_421381 [Dothidotthia symphoricarpi CBS 119687]KAF2132450.1 hypothetical protein P153DRAFT_421381 [Dothidotthia symphoricarpi CBS 119687]